jgi:hypothetical protein
MILCIHTFEARYTEVENARDIKLEGNKNDIAISDEAFKNMMFHKEYLGDICTKCGLFIPYQGIVENKEVKK